MSDQVPYLGLSLGDLGFYVLPLEWELFETSLLRATWFNSCAWRLVRITGRWPLPLLGIQELPGRLTCPACGEDDVPVLHMLGGCVATQWPLQQLQLQTAIPSHSNGFLACFLVALACGTLLKCLSAVALRQFFTRRSLKRMRVAEIDRTMPSIRWPVKDPCYVAAGMSSFSKQA